MEEAEGVDGLSPEAADGTGIAGLQGRQAAVVHPCTGKSDSGSLGRTLDLTGQTPALSIPQKKLKKALFSEISGIGIHFLVFFRFLPLMFRKILMEFS